MTQPAHLFFDHSRHILSVHEQTAPLDVLAFEGVEELSRNFAYSIEFTSAELDIPAESMLAREASFSLRALVTAPVFPGDAPATQPALRTLHGVITAFRRVGSSRDESRYEVKLEPRLALLGYGAQYRIYQNQSVPEIVESVLRRHGFRGEDFLIQLARKYPDREQVMQYAETDLAFIQRLCAEVGIWYFFSVDTRLNIEVVEFHDDPGHYQHGLSLPLLTPSGMSSSGEDAVWDLQVSHQVVQRQVSMRAYHARDAAAHMDGQVDLARQASTTYGEAYHYADPPYTVPGDPFALGHEEGHAESGAFYARLAHERYLNDQTRLAGVSTSASLAPGHVLKVEGGAPQSFADGALIVRLRSRAARDRSHEVHFEAIPDNALIGFRPAVPPKVTIPGTLPARVTSTRENDPYSHIDPEGRYRVSFLFDRDQWKPGQESMWLRLARPYAGDTHGLHLPLLAGTEVAVAFEQGDPDRPYIAHALHDNRHPDHVTLRNYKRNVLRTPANNKLRMDDSRGQEHIKLSTEHSGKSQLNLGHLVDAQKQRRGEGFELRTDGWGSVRAGKGVFISADEQSKAQGQVLDMKPAVTLMENASQQLKQWQEIAKAHHSRESNSEGLRDLLDQSKDLKGPAVVLSAPKGIAAVTPASLLLDSNQSMYLQSQDEINLTAAQRLAMQSNQGMSLLAQREGIRLVSGRGPLEIESHGDILNVIAQQDITVQSVQGHLQLTAKNGITLACGGGYIRITPSGAIDIHSPGQLLLKGQHVWEAPTSQDYPLPELPQSVCKECLLKGQAAAAALLPRIAAAPAPSLASPMNKTSFFEEEEEEEVGTSEESGPGVWVTIDDDFHGLINTVVLLANRAVSLGDEGRFVASDGKDYKNTIRDKIQEWQALPGDAPTALIEDSAIHKYGEIRKIRQRYLEGDDSWAESGSSWHWQPVVADRVFELKNGAGKYE